MRKGLEITLLETEWGGGGGVEGERKRDRDSLFYRVINTHTDDLYQLSPSP